MLMKSSIGSVDGYNTLSSIGMQDTRDPTGMNFNNTNKKSTSANLDMGTLAQQMVNELLHGKKNVNDYLAPL